ncbi:MAG: T9SS type A sorting domain-containing protein, partial [Syntrophothermus sp.]
GWDTAWYKPGTLSSDSLIKISAGDSSRWVKLQTQFPSVEPVANIGCEQCHGPANDHANTADPTKVDVSQEGGVCMQCHDSPPVYTIGNMWKKSNHATLPLSGEETARTACFPCHRGPAFVKFANNKAAPGYVLADDNIETIACQSCHDPHGNANPSSIRLATIDSLVNGYKPSSNPAFKGGSGSLCMNCHHARENSFVRVTNQQKKFADRFYPHYSPQSDMFVGANAYEYDLKITGTGTHIFMQNACVTCHMAANPDTLANPSGEMNHFMKMQDENGKDRVYICKPCHPSVSTSFEDIKAKSDYDGNGKIEGTQIEIQGLLDKLKAVLPKDSTGEVVTMAKDSMLVKNAPGYPRILPAMWDYYFVRNDWSKGVHNATYAVAILQRSLAQVTGVEKTSNTIPAAYSLEQNYPNPFNPVTTIAFSLPENANVTLTIFDAAGREVATLQKGFMTAGKYKVTWSPGSTASGIYYYRLNSDKFTMVRKMVFLK